LLDVAGFAVRFLRYAREVSRRVDHRLRHETSRSREGHDAQKRDRRENLGFKPRRDASPCAFA
jgi:hypothetical protein